MNDAFEPPVWDLSGLYRGRDDPAIDRDLAEAARLLDAKVPGSQDYERAVALLARLHAFGSLFDGGRGEAALHGRVNAVALRSPVPNGPESPAANGVDAMITAVALRGPELWAAAQHPDPHPVTRHWRWREARDLAAAAARSLSPQAGAAVERTFSEDRVHARHPGAPLTHPAGDRGPYVRLEFDGSLKSVLVLAHEAGHAAHQMLSRPLGVLRCGPRPALAEVAASTNEQAAFGLMLGQAGREEREGLLAFRRRDLAAIVVRHAALHRFEQQSHGQPADALWLRMIEQVAGPKAARAERGDGWRAYPVLTRAPGTAWTYAFARLTAIALLARRDSDPAAYSLRWTTLLSAGGTVEERSALSPFWIDPEAPAFWTEAAELAVGQSEARDTA